MVMMTAGSVVCHVTADEKVGLGMPDFSATTPLAAACAHGRCESRRRNQALSALPPTADDDSVSISQPLSLSLCTTIYPFIVPDDRRGGGRTECRALYTAMQNGFSVSVSLRSSDYLPALRVGPGAARACVSDSSAARPTWQLGDSRSLLIGALSSRPPCAESGEEGERGGDGMTAKSRVAVGRWRRRFA